MTTITLDEAKFQDLPCWAQKSQHKNELLKAYRDNLNLRCDIEEAQRNPQMRKYVIKTVMQELA